MDINSVNCKVLTRHQKEFRNINFQVLQPYLNKYELLPRDQTAYLRPINLLDNDRTDRFYAELLQSRDKDRIRKLIQCLRECRENVDAHMEIADALEEQLKAMTLDNDTADAVVRKCNIQEHPTIKVPVSVSKPAEDKIEDLDSKVVICSKKWVCGYFVTVGLLCVFLVLLVVLAIVPAATDSPFFPIRARTGVLIRMEFSLDLKWLSSGFLHYQRDCDGSVVVIEGSSCDDLNTTTSSQPGSERNLRYMLPTSSIEIIFPANETLPQDVWIFTTVEAFDSYQNIDDLVRDANFKCSQKRSDGSVCISTVDYIGTSFIYNVTRSGFYSVCHNHPFDLPVYSWVLNIVQHDVNALPDRQQVFRVNNSPQEFIIGSSEFCFRGDKCVLLHTATCDDSRPFVPVILSNLRRKQGIVLYTAIPMAIMLTVLVILVAAHVLTIRAAGNV